MKIAKIIMCGAVGLAVMATSCGGHGESSDSDTFATEMPAMDTTPEDTVKREDGTPFKHIRSYEEAMQYMEASGHGDRYKQGIIPQIARENIEYAEKLLNNTHSRFLVVDKGSMNVIVYDKYGVEEVHYGIACARNYGTKHKKADSRTPEGFFTAEGIYNSTDWLFTDDWGHTSQARGVFGPRFIRLKTAVTSQIGIHGTSSPGSIGRRTSHGCIRVTNENIMKLVKLVDKGMPIIVSPGPADQVVNEREGVKVYAVNTGYEPMKHKAPPASPKKATKTTDAVDNNVKEEAVPTGGEGNITPTEEVKPTEDTSPAPAKEISAPAAPTVPANSSTSTSPSE